MNRSLVTALAFASLTSGCFFKDTTLTEVLPDDRIEINLPVGTGAKADKEWATYYLLTADVTEEINTLIAVPLYWVDTITTRYPPTYVNEEKTEATWGPWNEGALDPAETQLSVQHDTATDIYTWGFERWPKESTEEEAVAVIAGTIDPGATREISTGRFTIDFTANHEIDPTDEATGLFSVDYDIHADGVTAVASFEGYGPYAIDATYSYDQLFDGEGAMDLGVISDLNPGSGTGSSETWLVRSRWMADGSGRADVMATGGDLGDVVAHASECWDSTFQRVYYTLDLDGTVEGDPTLCAYADASYPEE